MIILVVDNEGRYQEHVSSWLMLKWREWGRTDPMPEVRSAWSYDEALKILLKEGEHVCVLLSDLLISREKESCGPALYWFVCEKWPSIKVFFASAYPSEPILRMAGLDELPRDDSWVMLDPLRDDWCELGWLHHALFGVPAPETNV